MICSKCGKKVDDKLTVCSSCGAKLQGKPNFLFIGCISLVILVVVAIITLLLLTNYAMKNPEVTNKIIEQQVNNVLDKALTSYAAAEKAGNKAECCKEAGIISALYYQNKDDANFDKWDKIREEQCKASGGEGTDYSKYMDMYEKLSPEQKQALEKYRNAH